MNPSCIRKDTKDGKSAANFSAGKRNKVNERNRAGSLEYGHHTTSNKHNA